MRSIPTHVLFPPGHPLPLRWFRLPLLILTLGLSCVCIAVGGQALDKSSKLVMALNADARRKFNGSMVMFDMNDIKDTTIVLTTVACLLALTSLFFSFSLLYDWICHRLRPKWTKSHEKQDSTDELVVPGPHAVPFSTRTLGIQTLVLSFLSIWILAVLIPSTLFVRTRSAHVSITIPIRQQTLVLTTSSMYWDYGFLQCLAAAPWFSFLFSLPTSIVTWVAWKYNASPVGHSV